MKTINVLIGAKIVIADAQYHNDEKESVLATLTSEDSRTNYRHETFLVPIGSDPTKEILAAFNAEGDDASEPADDASEPTDDASEPADEEESDIPESDDSEEGE
jgi:hypothetical protein